MSGAVWSLVEKDLREHAVAIGLLVGGTVIVLALMLAQIQASEFTLNAMEVVRLSLLTLLPLLAFILGNRLIAREYLHKTRLFVEALPMPPSLSLLVKFFGGWLVLALQACLIVATTAALASAGDDINLAFAGLILAKTLVLATLFWSIAFCLSLCGHLRLILYLVLIAVAYYVTSSPFLDETRFGPFALIDGDIFPFERDIVPWSDLLETALLAIAFAAAGFALGLINEGSVAERLSKPMSRRDLVAVSLLIIGGVTIFQTLQKQWTQTPYELTGDQLVRSSSPPLVIRYEKPALRKTADAMLARLSGTLNEMRVVLGITRLPSVRLWMDQDMDPDELKLWTSDGVIIHVNFEHYDFYEFSILDTVVIHGVFQHLTANRAVFEANHWVTDGVSHWWARVPLSGAQLKAHDNEVLARAAIALERSPHRVDLIENFQLLADSIGHLSAEALAYSAVLYLEKIRGQEVIHALSRNFVTQPVPDNVFGTIADRAPGAKSRFEAIAGIPWAGFMEQWRAWLSERATEPGIAQLIALVPRVDGQIDLEHDAQGIVWLRGTYLARPDYLGDQHAGGGRCVLKYDRLGAIDEEIWLDNDIRDEAMCKTGEPVHRIQSPFARGERAYVTMQFEHPRWHWPVMLKSRRLTVE